MPARLDADFDVRARAQRLDRRRLRKRHDLVVGRGEDEDRRGCCRRAGSCARERKCSARESVLTEYPLRRLQEIGAGQIDGPSVPGVELRDRRRFAGALQRRFRGEIPQEVIGPQRVGQRSENPSAAEREGLRIEAVETERRVRVMCDSAAPVSIGAPARTSLATLRGKRAA